MWTAINNILKRFGDILLSLLALVVLSPVMLVCAIWVKLDSNGPVIFRQDRLTKNGKVFKMMKFRSMVQDAEKQGTGARIHAGEWKKHTGRRKEPLIILRTGTFHFGGFLLFYENTADKRYMFW